jgi:serine protease DegQ
MSLPSSSESLVALVDTAGPALVRIDGPHQAGATGLSWPSGVAGDPDRIVVTAHHALRHDEPLQVTLSESDDPPRPAHLLGRDPTTDLAVLRVPGAGQASVAPTWRDDATVRVGELGLALARPGRSTRAALALVAVVGREGVRAPGGRTIAPWVELDRGLPRGFSVATLLDLEGRVLGLATAGLVPNATVLLTASVVRASVEAIVAHGHVPHGYLGVGVSPARLPGDLRQQLGQGRALAVVGLVEGGPAARAGVLVGDVILAVGGTPVRSPRSLRARLSDAVGQPVAVRLLRGGQITELEIIAESRQ